MLGLVGRKNSATYPKLAKSPANNKSVLGTVIYDKDLDVFHKPIIYELPQKSKYNEIRK